MDKINALLAHLNDPWLIIGFLGQALFTMRFVVQWVHSERMKKSVVPAAFWFFSMAGGTVLLAYALYKQDPVFIAGQGLGLLIYLRNIAFIIGGIKKTQRQETADDKIALSVMLDQLEERLQAQRSSLMEKGAENLDQLLKG